MSHSIDPTSTPRTASGEQGGVSRRAVVKTGANLAWAVPAISLVTAAPALAVSGGTPKLAMGNVTANGTRTGASVSMGAVRNTGDGDAGRLTAVATFPANRDNVKVVGSSVSNGWKVADGSGDVVTFVTVDGNLAPGERSKPLSFRVTHKSERRVTGSVKVVVKGSEGGTDSDSDSL